MQGGSFIWFIGLFVLMYFIMIRPQLKQKKKRQELLNSVAKGEKIITVGGICGTITALSKDSMVVEIAPNVRIKMLRTAISVRSTDEEEADENLVEENEADNKK